MQNVIGVFAFALALVIAGCGAGFSGPQQPSTGGQTTIDGGTADFAVANNADLATAAAGDLAGTPAVADMATGTTGPQTIASGVFVKGQQNGGDTGHGSATLARATDGSVSAIFGADFQSTQVPAGEVVLTSRSAIGTGGIAAGDLDLGPLKSATGAQQYAVPAGDGGRRNLFVYCVTYGIDVAVAHLQ